MVDRGEADTVAAVLRRVDSRLHGIDKGIGRRLVVASSDNELDRSGTFPRTVGLAPADAGQSLGNFDILPAVEAVGLILKAVEVAQSQGLGCFFVFAVDNDTRQLRGRKPLDILDRDKLTGVAVRVRTGGLAGKVILERLDFLGHGPVVFIAGEASADRNIHTELADTHGAGCRQRRDTTLRAAHDKVVSARGVGKGLVEYGIESHVNHGTLKGVWRKSVENNRALALIEARRYAGELLLKNRLIGFILIHRFPPPNRRKCYAR